MDRKLQDREFFRRDVLCVAPDLVGRILVRRLPDGTVLRLSASRVTMGVLLLSMFPAILAVIAVALILSGILAGRVSRRITRPLNTLDLEHPLF